MKKKPTLRTICGGAELAGVAFASAGLGMEIVMKADLGYMFITGGAVIIAAGSLLFNKALRGVRR